jgi:DNA repair exonuclease SbcCD ATPase subunit
MTIQELRRYVEQQKGRKAQIEGQVESLTVRIKESQKNLRRHEEAREIIRSVGIKTQEQLQFHISDITSLALDAVYTDPYVLKAEFVQRRNKTECDLYFIRNEEHISPMDAAGGGVVNIASFALRVASWSMQKPRSNNVLILDEPFGNVSVDLLPRASEMLRRISKQLELQIIMVTHANELMETADKTFQAHIRRGVTEVE